MLKATLVTILFGLTFHTTSARATSIDMAAAMYVEPSVNIVQEGNGEGDPQQITFTVNLGYGDTIRPQTVDYEIVPGTATPTEDYEPLPPGSLVFAEGERTKSVVVKLVGDRTPECTEDLFLRLSRGGIPILDAIARIKDDDADVMDGGAAPSCTTPDRADGGADSTLITDSGPLLDSGLPNDATLLADSALQPVTTLPPDSALPTSPEKAQASGCSIGTPSSGSAIALGILYLLLAVRQRSLGTRVCNKISAHRQKGTVSQPRV